MRGFLSASRPMASLDGQVVDVRDGQAVDSMAEHVAGEASPLAGPRKRFPAVHEGQVGVDDAQTGAGAGSRLRSWR